MYRSWRKAKRKNAQLVLAEACGALWEAATKLGHALEDAEDRVIAALS